MDEERQAEDAGGRDRSAGMATSGTFMPCGPVPQSGVDRIEASELFAVARTLGMVFRQTVSLFCWATGASTIDDVTPEAIEVFCRTLSKVDARFGTVAHHLEMSVADVIASASTGGKSPRDGKTIARHRNRLRKLAAHNPARFEDRIDYNGAVRLTDDEIARLGGAGGHRGFLFVERLGEIRFAIALRVFDRMLEPSASARMLTPLLIEEAARTADDMEDHGSAFVATVHGERIILIPGFWNARASPD